MDKDIILKVSELDLWYGEVHALHQVNLPIANRKVTSLIGPSGCGKSTLIRCFNRMNDLVNGCRISGCVEFHGENIYGTFADPVDLRKKIGMVFQKPNPFPKSIFENVAYGLRVHGNNDKTELKERVEASLKESALWDEVKDKLDSSAMGLSGGQQQRLCIARTIAVEPEVILMDEPCSALDPISTTKIEDLIHKLKNDFTIIIVTHNMQQATRVSKHTAFFLHGEIIEKGLTDKIFIEPEDKRTEDYITGRFG